MADTRGKTRRRASMKQAPEGDPGAQLYMRTFRDDIFFERYEDLSAKQIRFYLDIRKGMVRILTGAQETTAVKKSRKPRRGDMDQLMALGDLGFIEIGPVPGAYGE